MVLKRKLKFREIQAARLALRSSPGEFLVKIGSLFDHIEALDLEIKKLEEENREMRRKLLPPLPAPPRTVPEKKENQIVGVPLRERLATMIEEGVVDSEAWKKTLYWNMLTYEKALEMAAPVIQSREAERQKSQIEGQKQDLEQKPSQT